MEDLSPHFNDTACHVRHVVWSLPVAPCDRCTRSVARVWETRRTALDIDLERPVLLLVTVSVHHCRPCHHYFRARPPFLRPDATYTTRVVAKAVRSVYEDGMARTRVAQRLARDFWVRPSEAMIRRWCRDDAAALTLDGDDTAWVVAECSGILCVDEVYKDKLAVLLAVDPAAPEGDRLSGYQWVHGEVTVATMRAFLARLRAAGSAPEQVITDGSPLYPATLAAVWPTAAHQLCLFHQTRDVTKAVLQTVREIRASLPVPPRRRPGRRRRGPAGAVPEGAEDGEPNDAAGPAQVRALRRRGLSIHGIVRQTGFARNTVRTWLRDTSPIKDMDMDGSFPPPPDIPGAVARPHPSDHGGGVSGESGAPTRPGRIAPPPAPWESWAQVRQIGDELRTQRFLFVHRPDHLNDEERARLHALLTSPVGAALRPVRAFVEDWYAIWRTPTGGRRPPDEACDRYQRWRTNPLYAHHAPLRRAQERLAVDQCARLSVYLGNAAWEATNNAAERAGRAFRHTQAPHVQLRTAEAIAATLRVQALHRTEEQRGGEGLCAPHASRGRRPGCRPIALAA